VRILAGSKHAAGVPHHPDLSMPKLKETGGAIQNRSNLEFQKHGVIKFLVNQVFSTETLNKSKLHDLVALES